VHEVPPVNNTYPDPQVNALDESHVAAPAPHATQVPEDK